MSSCSRFRSAQASTSAGGRQEIALVVVASAIGKDEVFDSINAAADTRYEMVGLRCPAERPAAVKAAAGLQVGQALAQGLGRGQPVPSEKVAVQVLLFGGDVVDRGHHPGPVQLNQRADQRRQAHEPVARALAQPHREPGRTIAVQPAPGERLPRSPVDVIKERKCLLTGADDLQARQRLLGYRNLYAVQHLRVFAHQPLAGQGPAR